MNPDRQFTLVFDPVAVNSEGKVVIFKDAVAVEATDTLYDGTEVSARVVLTAKMLGDMVSEEIDNAMKEVR